MWSMRRRWLLKNIVAFFVYGGLFSLLRNGLQSSILRNHIPDVPSIAFEHEIPMFNESKVALLIENRPLDILAPLLIHFMSIVPPDWKFRFMGSPASIWKVNNSAAVQQQVDIGKLDLTYIPPDFTTSGQEEISSFLTNRHIIENVLRPAEWLLVFQTDSMICGRHAGTLDEWLDYAWVGAPWYPESRYGGNGGLSLRRISSITEVLRHQSRERDSEPEDVWLTERIGHLPGIKTPTGIESKRFAVEAIWFDEPLGYHTGGGGEYMNRFVWGSLERREHIFEYCPEMKMTLDMDLDWAVDVCYEQF